MIQAQSGRLFHVERKCLLLLKWPPPSSGDGGGGFLQVKQPDDPIRCQQLGTRLSSAARYRSPTAFNGSFGLSIELFTMAALDPVSSSFQDEPLWPVNRSADYVHH